MKRPAETKIKICCIASEAEAGAAVSAGAWAIGLVSEMPSGPGVIDEALIARITAVVEVGPAEGEVFFQTRSSEKSFT